ncbi:hypothetical protein [Pedobacter sp.]|uniref:hypothetical protein n=1 Tax=Pedobacter sp. TaxID=1411316 RepID=UPI003BAD7A54
MKKILIAITLFLTVKGVIAQDLVKKIPTNAFTVATIKGDNLFKLMFVKDFDESFLGKKFLTGASKSLDKNFNSIEDFGINLDKSMYYFNQLNDSITYHHFLIPIKDANKFDELIKSKESRFEKKGEIRTYILPDSSGILMWNNTMLCGVNGSIKSSFFADSTKSAKYGIKDIRYQNEYDQTAVAVDSATVATYPDTTYTEEVAAPVAPPKVKKKVATTKSKKKATPKARTGAKKTIKKKKQYTPPPVADAETVEVVDVPMAADAAVEAVAAPADDYDEYQQARAEQDAKKKKLALEWITDHAAKILNTDYESIDKNKSYTESLDQSAIASLWVSSLQDVYGSVAPEFGTYGKANIMKGYGSLNAKLFMDKTSFRISTGLELAKEQADAYKKIMNKKINKNFLKYVNSEKAIGFMGYSIDTKAYLEEFPKFMKQAYGSFLGASMEQEIEIGSDLFSLILDEEAVSKVVKGDALFVINGLNSKEVTYTSYDYDDDYNRKEVTKTKKETLPDFLFMFSSEDTRLFNKLINYGINKKLVSVDQNVYKIAAKQSPVDIYFLIKDGIVFFGNSLTEIQSISNNSYRTNISKPHKNLLAKNNFSFLFNAKNLVGKVPDEEIGGKETAAKFNETLGKMGNIYMKSNPIKGNIVSADISAEIPNGHENALKYLFSLIENAAK